MPTFTLYDIEVDERIISGLDYYINEGVPTGGFLRAVIENNLKEAVAKADNERVHMIPAIVGYLFNHAPVACWGDSEAWTRWVELKRLHRQQAGASTAPATNTE